MKTPLQDKEYWATNRLLTVTEVMARLQIGRTTLWELERRGEFPQSTMLGRRCKRWQPADIEDFIAGRWQPTEEVKARRRR